jgi:PAS domain S-box-containing protein
MSSQTKKSSRVALARPSSHEARIRELEERVRSLEGQRARWVEAFRRLGEADLLGIGLGDREGGVSYVNDEMLRMLGRSRADLDAGRIDWLECAAPEHRDELAAGARALFETGASGRLRSAFLRPDGSRTHFLGVAAVVEPESGGHVAVAMDVTAMVEAKAALREADRRKNQALATVAHDLRNPLGALATAVDLLESDASAASLAQVRGIMRRQVAQMTRLVRDLLEVTEAAAGTLRVVLGEVDLSGLVRATVQDHWAALGRHGVALALELPAEPVCVRADAGRLAQVLGNLLHNAMKFSPEGSTTTVRLTPETDEHGPRVSVRDTGIGIAPRDLHAVFEPFVQLDVNVRGFGLGLSIVRALVELHGGAVEIESEGLGRGTEVRVTLPRSAALSPSR